MVNITTSFTKDIAKLEREVKKIKKCVGDPAKTAGEFEKFFSTNSNDVKKFKADSQDPDNVKVGEYLQELLKIHNPDKKQVKEHAMQDDTNFHRIFGGKQQQRPAREKLIAIALAMGLNRDEVDFLLFLANVSALCVRNRWDAVIIYAIKNKKSVTETQEILNELNLFPSLIAFDKVDKI